MHALLLQFAYCYPYSYTQLQAFLDGIDKLRLDYFKRELLCHSVVSLVSFPHNVVSLVPFPHNVLSLVVPAIECSAFCFCIQQQRRLDLLTITSPENLRPGSQTKTVFVTARVHPGETPSSFVCQGEYIIVSVSTL